jgi:hypothetical protein
VSFTYCNVSFGNVTVNFRIGTAPVAMNPSHRLFPCQFAGGRSRVAPINRSIIFIYFHAVDVLAVRFVTFRLTSTLALTKLDIKN